MFQTQNSIERLQNRATLHMTLVPMKAGHRTRSAFTIAFSILTIAPGFVTNCDKFCGMNMLFAASLTPLSVVALIP